MLPFYNNIMNRVIYILIQPLNETLTGHFKVLFLLQQDNIINSKDPFNNQKQTTRFQNFINHSSYLLVIYVEQINTHKQIRAYLFFYRFADHSFTKRRCCLRWNILRVKDTCSVHFILKETQIYRKDRRTEMVSTNG